MGFDFGDFTRAITENTTDKWIAPEHKDSVEAIAGMVAALTVGAPMLSNIGSFATGATGSATIGSMASNAALAAMGGGDPKQGAILAGVGAIRGNLPGGLGTFFSANPIGQNLIQAFASSGGDMGAIGNILGNLGFGGKQKDVIEQVLALMALAGISKEFAKDAISKANRLEGEEEAVINEMITTARSIVPTDENDELMYRKLADTTASEYRQVYENFTHELSTKGMLDTNIAAGQLRRIGQEAAAQNLENRREIMLSRPERSAAALTAMGTALTPLDQMAQRARATAEEQRMLPFNIAKDLYAANRRSPIDDYYAAMTEDLKNRQYGDAGAGTVPLVQIVPDQYGPQVAQTGGVSQLNAGGINFGGLGGYSSVPVQATQQIGPSMTGGYSVAPKPVIPSGWNTFQPKPASSAFQTRPTGASAFNLPQLKLSTRYAY